MSCWMEVKELMSASSIFVRPSSKGVSSRSIMEAMASGLLCIVSRIQRGMPIFR